MGRFSPAAKQSTTVNICGSSNADQQFIVNRLIEIIVDEVEDGPTASRIGDRIKTLIGASRVATEVIESQTRETGEFAQPQVAPMRPPSETIKAIRARAGIQQDSEDGGNKDA
jgi:hypothetical protein